MLQCVLNAETTNFAFHVTKHCTFKKSIIGNTRTSSLSRHSVMNSQMHVFFLLSRNSQSEHVNVLLSNVR